MTARKPVSSRVPAGRLSRLTRFGALASGVAGGMLAEGARQLAKGNRPRLSDLLLTPDNMRRVTDQLAQLRGAAMKLGQLLSMDDGDLLPPQLTEILSRLRADAHHMPPAQLTKVLNRAWGKHWPERLASFSFTPIAAASIGQVHAARSHEGVELAIKIQYPGVRESIASDVDNVVSLLRLSGLLPSHLDLAELIAEAKRQLHQEADYLKEGEHLSHYRQLLADSPDFILPEVLPAFTTRNVLAMSFVPGEPIESLVDATQERRDRVAGLLFDLLFRELFEFRRVQTDPNFANYRFDPASDKLVLLDFGATRIYTKARVEAYRRLLSAGQRSDQEQLALAAADIGYFQEAIEARHKHLVLAIFQEVLEPLRAAGPYDFGRTDLSRRLRELALPLGLDRDFWHTPPVDALFLHRKMAGLFLLAAKLKARVDVARLFQPYAARAAGASRAD